MKYSIDYNNEVKGKYELRKEAISEVQTYAFLLQKNGAKVVNRMQGSFDYYVPLADGNMSDKRRVAIIKW